MSACTLKEVKVGTSVIALVKINRPDAANSFDAAVMKDLTELFKVTIPQGNFRAVILSGEGKHFSAGADLNWMKDAAKLTYVENIADSNLLLDMFTAYEGLVIPTIAVVKGAAFGGAVGLIAASDIVLADEKAKLCLSEAKLGLLPAVIYPFLLKRIPRGALKRWALTARVLTADEAKSIHLVDRVCENLSAALIEELNLVLSCGPKAQTALKELHYQICDQGLNAADLSVNAIAKARTGDEGQGGLAAFFQKTKPDWVEIVDDKVSIDL